MLHIPKQNGSPAPDTRLTVVPEACKLLASRFAMSYSQYPMILTTKKLKPPCISCPCQFSYIGGDALAQQPSQRGRPLMNSATHVIYALSPHRAYARPGVLRDGSHINIQNAAITKAKKKYPKALKKEEFHCKACDKSFSRKSSLVVHMRRHTGEKPFKCVYCPKAFAQSANQVAHLRTHTGEKPYACPVCGKCFSQSSSITTHMRTHTGERPFQCSECGMAFAERSTLSKHHRVHTKKPNLIKASSMKGFAAHT